MAGGKDGRRGMPMPGGCGGNFKSQPGKLVASSQLARTYNSEAVKMPGALRVKENWSFANCAMAVSVVPKVGPIFFSHLNAGDVGFNCLCMVIMSPSWLN